MRLYLPEIRKKRGRALVWHYAGPIPGSFGVETSPGDSLEVELKASATGDKILLEGTLQAALTVSCSRCLKPFRQNLKTDFGESFTVHLPGEKEKETTLLAGEAAGELVQCGNYLCLKEYLRQLFLLMQELKPLCRADCPGICPHCGADRSSGGCCCEDRPGDPRLGKLKDLLP